MTLTVLCAGDRFITADTLADAARAALGNDVWVRTHISSWPDVPFRAVDGVREAAGDVIELVAAVAGADVLLTHLAPVTEAVLAAGQQLRLVGSVRGGPVNIDVEAATRRGIPVAYLPGRNLGAVAEFVVAAMISAPRGPVAAAHDLRGGTWDASAFRFERTGTELRVATVGLVGLGAVGSRVAELVSAFGATVLAHDPYADPAGVPGGVRLVDLDELFAGSDVVSVHARLTDETLNMFNDRAFAAMKPGVCFVNSARGELVDEAALAAALESGQVGSAALDVFHPEPPESGSALLAHPRVVATPHLAGASRQVAQESAAKVAAAAAGFLRGEGLAHCANPDVLTHQANPDVLTHQANPDVLTHQANPDVLTHQANPDVLTHQANPDVLTHQANPDVLTHQTNPDVLTHQTNPDVLTHQTNPDLLTHQAEER